MRCLAVGLRGHAWARSGHLLTCRPVTNSRMITAPGASGSVNRCLRFLAQSDPTMRPGS
jgi:hypothetical protein